MSVCVCELVCVQSMHRGEVGIEAEPLCDGFQRIDYSEEKVGIIFSLAFTPLPSHQFRSLGSSSAYLAWFEGRKGIL